MKGMRDGYRNECKSCNLAAKAQRYRANPEREKERVRQWRLANPERYREKQAHDNAKPQRAAANRRTYLKRKYGITLEQYDEMLGQQSGRCAICNGEPAEGRLLHVDHDHTTGRIRGLLCFTCNNGIGDFRDDPDLLRKAAEYVRGYDATIEEEIALARARVRDLVRS